MQSVGAIQRTVEGREECSWYAIYTRHQHEKTVARLLNEKQFNVYLPVYKAVRQWGDRTKLIYLPLFPSYVFLWGTLERRAEIVRTPGLVNFVGTGLRPARIPQVEIDTIRQALANGSQFEPWPFVRLGDRVRVRWGPLKGIEGILIRKKNSFRLVLSVELLQKSIAVEVDALSVERAPDNRRLERSRTLVMSQGVIA